jgi:hypothetical protein
MVNVQVKVKSVALPEPCTLNAGFIIPDNTCNLFRLHYTIRLYGKEKGDSGEDFGWHGQAANARGKTFLAGGYPRHLLRRHLQMNEYVLK